MNKWFGASWGAAVCDPEDHTETPVGRPCLRCGKPIEDGDQGLVSPYVFYGETGELASRPEPTHIDCFLESIRPCPGCPNCKPEAYN